MKNSYIESIISFKEEIYPQIFKIKVENKDEIKPGQFYMIRAWDNMAPFLSRPISVSDYNGKEITFLVQEKHLGTKLITNLEVGESIKILGPLGNGFDVADDMKIAIVSGGIGIAPFLYLAKSIDGEIDLYSGFRDREYYIEEFLENIQSVKIATDNGASGYKGFVTDLINPEDYDLVIGCGPTPMMKKLSEICQGKVDLQISLENNMACGVGACMGCNVETENGSKRVCKEGPVFMSRELI